MASLFKRGKRWCIDYCDPSGRRVRKAVSRYKETAQKALKKIEIEMVEGKYLDIRRQESILFKDFAQKFRCKHIRRRNKSIRNQEYLLDSLIRQFGDKLMHEISANDIDGFLEHRHQNCSASTVNKDLTMIKSMYNRANEWADLIDCYPAKNIKRIQENNERCRYLTQEEQQRLLLGCSGTLRMIVLTAIKSGLRRGEILNLKWQQAPNSNYVDFVNNAIFVHESLAKSKKSRYIPLAPSLKQALLDYPQYDSQGYIFINPHTGKPITTIRKSFLTALKGAGITDFRFHDLRHVFSSNLVNKGVDLYVVQKLLGHSSPEMTQRYAHLGNSFLKKAIGLMDDKIDDSLEFGHNMVTLPS